MTINKWIKCRTSFTELRLGVSKCKALYWIKQRRAIVSVNVLQALNAQCCMGICICVGQWVKSGRWKKKGGQHDKSVYHDESLRDFLPQFSKWPIVFSEPQSQSLSHLYNDPLCVMFCQPGFFTYISNLQACIDIMARHGHRRHVWHLQSSERHSTVVSTVTHFLLGTVYLSLRPSNLIHVLSLLTQQFLNSPALFCMYFSECPLYWHWKNALKS